MTRVVVTIGRHFGGEQKHFAMVLGNTLYDADKNQLEASYLKSVGQTVEVMGLGNPIINIDHTMESQRKYY